MGGGEGRSGWAGGERGSHFGIPHPQDIFTTERTRGGSDGGGGGSFVVGFICIDPQDSDREQLEIEGTEHKVWAYYIRCCLRGGTLVLVIITVCQGKQTNRTSCHRRI